MINNNNPSTIPNSMRNPSKEFPYIGESVDIFESTFEKPLNEVICIPDEEDTTNINNRTKFKDKDYNPIESSGLGRVYLRQNFVDGWPSNTWLYHPVNGVVYLLYSYNLELYAIYSNSVGLGLENNLVVAPANYNISDIQNLVGNRYLSFTESEGVYTITKPDGTTITSTELNNTSIYKLNDTEHKGVNVLVQKMMLKPNTIYHIQYDYDLMGQTINVPENCVLKFEGGSISNGTLIGQYTAIDAEPITIFGNDIIFSGTWNVYGFQVNWFGAIPDYDFDHGAGTDCTSAINKAIAYAENLGVHNVLFSAGYYFVGGNVVINKGDVCLNGIKGYPNESDWGGSWEQHYTGIYSNTDRVIVVGANTTKPFEIRNLNFTNDYSVNANFTSVAISYESEYAGPVWPIEISHCHFQGYDKAIHFVDGPNPYCAAWVHIHDCAFFKNNVCVYCDDHPSGLLWKRMMICDLNFENNKCHGNGCILRVAQFFQQLNISKCNIESASSTNIDGTQTSYDYIFDIITCQSGGIIFSGIYGENIKKYIAKIKAINGSIVLRLEDILLIDSGHGDYFYFHVSDGPLFLEKSNISSCKVVYKGNPFTSKGNFLLNYTVDLNGNNASMQYNSTLTLHPDGKVENGSLNLNYAKLYNSGSYKLSDVFTGGVTNLPSNYTYVDDNNRLQLVGDSVEHDVKTLIGGEADKTSYKGYRGITLITNSSVTDGSKPDTEAADAINIAMTNKAVTACARLVITSRGEMFFGRGLVSTVQFWNRVQAIHSGATGNRTQTYPISGLMFFDETIGKPTWYNGSKWIESDGAIAGSLRSGTFANKPTVATNNIPVGFKYFCTDRQTTEGATNGIEIIHKGNNVWVDALGRVVS